MLSLPQEARNLGADLILHRDAPLGASRAWDRKDNTPSHGLLRCRELIQENALTASMDVLVPNRNEIRVECHGRAWGIRLLCSKSKGADDRDNRRRP